ncbi:thioredoxin family protein [Clostridium thermarum]|uniref:thioredoxin family protein n=1 Tax=Clostridium thermarum TaxID=1716543 RepID=UPI0013D8C2FA|nr:thioredoxin family protein [Clostridium thermarum]
MKEYKATVLNFGAAWCNDWYLQIEVLQAIERELRTPVKFLNVDVDNCPLLARKYDIKELPTIVILHNEKIKKIITSTQKKEKIFDEIKKVL